MYPHYSIKCTYSQYEKLICCINSTYRVFDFGSPTGCQFLKKPTAVGFFYGLCFHSVSKHHPYRLSISIKRMFPQMFPYIIKMCPWGAGVPAGWGGYISSGCEF